MIETAWMRPDWLVGRGGLTPHGARVAGVTGKATGSSSRRSTRRHVPAVVKALTEARLNAYALDPRTVAVGVPPVSGEQRQELARHVKKLGDEAKVAVRMIRQDARKQIAARGRGSERAVQEATDAAVGEIERLVKAKVDGIGA